VELRAREVGEPSVGRQDELPRGEIVRSTTPVTDRSVEAVADAAPSGPTSSSEHGLPGVAHEGTVAAWWTADQSDFAVCGGGIG